MVVSAEKTSDDNVMIGNGFFVFQTSKDKALMSVNETPNALSDANWLAMQLAFYAKIN